MKTSRIIIFFISVLLPYSPGNASEYIFNHWNQKKIGQFSKQVIQEVISTSNHYKIEVNAPLGIDSELRQLELIAHNGEHVQILGRGLRDITVSLHQTQFGEIIAVKHQYDTHHNEIFILRIILNKKTISVETLYSTPPPSIAENKDNCILIDVNWDIMRITSDGILELSCSWKFNCQQTAYQKEAFKILLFYGFLNNG